MSMIMSQWLNQPHSLAAPNQPSKRNKTVTSHTLSDLLSRSFKLMVSCVYVRACVCVSDVKLLPSVEYTSLKIALGLAFGGMQINTERERERRGERERGARSRETEVQHLLNLPNLEGEDSRSLSVEWNFPFDFFFFFFAIAIPSPFSKFRCRSDVNAVTYIIAPHVFRLQHSRHNEVIICLSSAFTQGGAGRLTDGQGGWGRR